VGRPSPACLNSIIFPVATINSHRFESLKHLFGTSWHRLASVLQLLARPSTEETHEHREFEGQCSAYAKPAANSVMRQFLCFLHPIQAHDRGHRRVCTIWARFFCASRGLAQNSETCCVSTSKVPGGACKLVMQRLVHFVVTSKVRLQACLLMGWSHSL
jgi:hypothetical protein